MSLTISINGQVLPIVEQPDEFFRTTGNIFIKRMYLKKKFYTCMGHSHKHSHISLLAHGSVMVKRRDASVIFKAPAFIDIEAGEHHQFIAMEDETVIYCIHDTHGLLPEDLGEEYKEGAH
jgi:quercetin dioxygenase-like cupin family protein